MPDFIQYQFWPWLLRASWQAGVIVLLVLAAQYLLGQRCRPGWRHAFWLLVMARLALPVAVPSAVSLFNVLARPSGAVPVAQADALPPQPQSRSSIPEGELLQARAVSRAAGVWPWFWLWGLGAIVMSARQGIDYGRLHRSVTLRRVLTDEAVLNLLEDCKQRMGIQTPITVVESAAVNGPCLFGFLRPRLLLPPGFSGSFSTDELRYVLLHELGHVKRLDIALGWLMTWLQVLHWFNPLVWVAVAKMRTDRELACDALALSHTDERDRKPYGRTVLKLLEISGQPLQGTEPGGHRRRQTTNTRKDSYDCNIP